MKRRLVFPLLATLLLVVTSHASDVKAGQFGRWRPACVSTQRMATPANTTLAGQGRHNSQVPVQNRQTPRGGARSTPTSTFSWGLGIHYRQ